MPNHTNDVIPGFSPAEHSPSNCNCCRRLTLEQLRTYLAVIDTKSFSAAASLLSKTQPTISHTISKLEEIFQVSLIIRHSGAGRTIELTEIGAQVARDAREILGKVQHTIHSATNSELTGVIRLGIPDDFCMGSLQQTLANCLRSNPQLRVQVTSAMPAQLLSHLQQHQLDMAIIKAIKPFPVVNTAQYNKEIHQETLHWVASEPLVFNNMAEIPLAVFADGCVYRRSASKALKEANRQWYISYTSLAYENIKTAISCGLGLSVLPASLIAPEHVVLDEQHGAPELPDLYTILLMNDDNTLNRKLAKLLIDTWQKSLINPIATTKEQLQLA